MIEFRAMIVMGVRGGRIFENSGGGMIQPISTSDLMKLTAGGDHTIVDTRPSAAYNGWALRGESRGGHIPGAISFPSGWFDDLGDDRARKLLLDKGMLPNSTIIITGYEDELKQAALRIEAIGYLSIMTHTEGMNGWLSDQGLPVEYLPRFRHLVHPDWLRKLLDGENPEPDTIKHHILAHVNFDNWGDYDEGHIPGAVWLDTLLLEDESTWNRHSPDELEEELRSLGITRDTCVVLYGRTADPNMSQEQPGRQAGQLGAMRAAALLLYAGVRNVRVLDGGLDSWLRSGGTITRDETLPVQVEKTGLRIPEHPEFMIDLPDVKRMQGDSSAALVSIRSWAENTGDVSGYHYIQKTGRIPGSIFGNNGSDAYHMERYRNHDDTMRSYHEIEANWRNAGITPDKHIAFYCGTGWRASEAFFDGWLMGWEHVSVYDGGWYEWSADPSNPIETGAPEEVTRMA